MGTCSFTAHSAGQALVPRRSPIARPFQPSPPPHTAAAAHRPSSSLLPAAPPMSTRSVAAAAASPAAQDSQALGVGPAASATLLCTSLTAATVEGMLAEEREAAAAGADIVELRIDFLEGFDAERDLTRLIQGCSLPVIVTYRPDWEGGKYSGPEPPRLAALKFAAVLGAAFVDIELKAADVFFTSPTVVETPTRFIVSSHDYAATPSEADLDALVARCAAAGADIVKFATTATDITDAACVLRVLRRAVASGQPTIALAMAERGQITRILAPKYGGFLTFGALSPERASAPGQPTLAQLRSLFRLPAQHANTKVYGIVGNPVSHSKSPAIHNAAMAAAGFDGVYVPLLVDDMARFLDAFKDDTDWAGLSVTIPHKEAALAGATSADNVAAAIGAANTLVRQSDGSMRAYNTDWSAAISAIERGLGGTGAADDAAASPLRGKTVVVVGAGGAGRALAFGAASRGAHVVIANRSAGRAEELAAAMGGGARGVGLDALASGSISGDILANTTSVGMHPDEEATPVPATVLSSYALVFDAVYTPLHTQLLRDAAAAGCAVVTGDEMFVGQAADQFRLFTGLQAPVDLMRDVCVVLGGTTGKKDA